MFFGVEKNSQMAPKHEPTRQGFQFCCIHHFGHKKDFNRLQKRSTTNKQLHYTSDYTTTKWFNIQRREYFYSFTSAHRMMFARNWIAASDWVDTTIGPRQFFGYLTLCIGLNLNFLITVATTRAAFLRPPT